MTGKIIAAIKEILNKKKIWIRVLITLGFLGLIMWIIVPKSCETKNYKYEQKNPLTKEQ